MADRYRAVRVVDVEALGRTVAPEDEFDADLTSDHDKALIAENAIVLLDKPNTKKKAA